MPHYDFKCQNCETAVVLECLMKDYKPIKKCPGCKKNKLIRDFSDSNIAGLGEPTTLGRLGEQHYKKLGNYERDSLKKADADRRIKTNKASPATIQRNKRIRKLATMTPEQKHKYIMTGKGID